MSYSVTLDVYEGPLELLLELVSKERLDPADVSISTITDEYLRVVAGLGELDLEVATHFLVLAATLLELKSFKLLPSRGAVDDDFAALLEERDHLVHRLIEFATFKGVAIFLTGAFAANEGHFVRMADIPKELVGPALDPLEGLSGEMLNAAAMKALMPRPRPTVDTTHVTPITISISDAVSMLLRQIDRTGTVTFRALCDEVSTRIEVIVRFLALLQMFKDQSVELEQDTPFGEIVVRRRDPIPEVSS